MINEERKTKGDGAVIYTRVSSPEQTSNTSLSSQEKRCREYCEEQGYIVVDVFPEDTGRTGRNANRPSFQKALEFCRDRKNKNIGHLIVFRFNRFFRNTKGHLVLYDELLEGFGVRTESATEDCNTDSGLHKRLRAEIAAAAEYESDDISEKARNGMREKRAEGNLTNTPPLGLKREWISHKENYVTHDAVYAPYIRQIFEFCDQGMLLKEILDNVNSQGFITPKGHKLKLNQLLRILRNIKYAGFVPVDKETEPVPATFEGIVDLDLFKRVQKRLDGKSSSEQVRSYKKDRPEFPLKRHILCAHCGKPITGSFSTSKSGKRHPYYHCRTQGCAGKGSTKPEHLHQVFGEIVSQSEVEPCLFAYLEKTIKDYSGDSMDRLQRNITAHLAQKNVLSARRQKLIDNFLDGKIDQSLYSEQMEIIENKLNESRKVLEREQQGIEAQQSDLDTYGVLFRDLQFLWENAPLGVRQALQSAMFPSVEWDITKDKIIVGESSCGLRSVN